MLQKVVDENYCQAPAMPRVQTVPLPVILDERIPDDYPARIIVEILDRLGWTDRENIILRNTGVLLAHVLRVRCLSLLF